MTDAEYKLEFGTTKYTPYLGLTGELWGAFVKIWKKNDRAITGPHFIYEYMPMVTYWNLADVSDRTTDFPTSAKFQNDRTTLNTNQILW